MSSENMETRTYEITGRPSHLDILEGVFGRIEALGDIGSSRLISVYVDGDGAVRLKIRRNGEKLDGNDKVNDAGGFIETLPGGNVKVDLG